MRSIRRPACSRAGRGAPTPNRAGAAVITTRPRSLARCWFGRTALLARLGALALVLAVCPARPVASGQMQEGDDGKFHTESGEPTYRIFPDGGIDWYTFNGFRRYHAECHMCHGPDGEGSTFAPSLLEPMKTMTYDTFVDIMVHGLRSVGPTQQRVMRAMGGDPNVMCYLEDIFVYLKARADGALGRSRPERRLPKPEAAVRREAACLDRE